MAGTAAKFYSRQGMSCVQTPFGEVSVGDTVRTVDHPTWPCAAMWLTVTAVQAGTLTVRDPHGDLQTWVFGTFCAVGHKKTLVKGAPMLNDLRSYVKENRQLLYTVALVIALDHFLFNGAFRERIKGLVESLLSSAEKKIG